MTDAQKVRALAAYLDQRWRTVEAGTITTAWTGRGYRKDMRSIARNILSETDLNTGLVSGRMRAFWGRDSSGGETISIAIVCDHLYRKYRRVVHVDQKDILSFIRMANEKPAAPSPQILALARKLEEAGSAVGRGGG